MAGRSSSPHVVVISVPAQGHVNAALDLSRKLASLGVCITFVCTEACIADMTKKGFDAGGLPICLHALPDSLPPHEKSMASTLVETLDQISVSHKVTTSLRPALEDMLVKLKEKGGVACVVYDFTLLWVGALGKELRLPAYIFQPFSSMFFLYFAHIPGLASQGRLPLTPLTDLSDESNMFEIPGLPPLHASEVPNISWDPNPVIPFQLAVELGSKWRDATGVLLNSVYELEKETVEALRDLAPEMDIKAVGPILPLSFLREERHKVEAASTAGSPEVRRCLQWLDEQPAASVLYVAFGTIACLSEEQAHELAMGLEASEQRFLWVVRIPQSEPRDHLLPRGFEERIKGRSFVLWELAPQRKILAHPAVGAFLTHSGWNSTLESICLGVPMLCWPMFSDQSINAKWVDVAARTGKLLRRNVFTLVTKEEVEGMVREVLVPTVNPSPLQVSAAHARQVACHSALDPSGSSSRNLHDFVKRLTETM